MRTKLMKGKAIR